MLSIAPLSSGQSNYYLSLASTAAGYYVDQKGMEPAGRWYGPCAAEFGLSGIVQADHLNRLCEGVHPHDQSHLVRNAKSEERAHGTDLCFSAPKSVSLAWALASPELSEAIERAMNRAVRDALDYMQATCGFARTGAQGQILKQVPLLFATFGHSSSRLGDVQLHTHCVCPNVTVHGVKPNGKLHTTAIDPTSYYVHKMTGGSIFRASLSASLRDLGFEIERDKSCFRIKGISEELCERTSQRRAEIKEALLERCGNLARLQGLSEEDILKSTSGRMAELINLETRKAKKELSRADIFESTREIAREMRIPEHHVEGLLVPRDKLSAEEKEALKDEIWRASIEKISETHSHWAERDLTRVIAEEAQGTGLRASDVRELVAANLANGQELVGVGTLVTKPKSEQKQVWRERTEERFTTRAILELEGNMLASVGRMSEKSDRVELRTAKSVIEFTRDKLAEEGKKMTREQAEAVLKLTTTDGKVACLVGKAGTSKSTILGSCRLAWERSGRTVLGCAVAGVAADSLKTSSGIESDTLAMTLARLKYGRLTLTDRHVLVLDEAGMVASKPMAELVGYVERAGASLTLAGDQDQLQPVAGAGGPFGSICNRIPKVATLTEIHRQREKWRRTTVEQLSRGEAKEALIAYAQHGQLHVTETRGEAFTKIVDLWKASGGHLKEQAGETYILAPMNCDVRTINNLCQKERLHAGQLSEQAVKLPNGDKLHQGDRILLTKKDRTLKVENGFTGEVVALDDQSQKLTVKLDTDGREVEISLKDYGKSLALGYCATVHKSQGLTRETVLVLLGGHMMDLHLSYVAGSRSKGDTHLVCDHQAVKKEPVLSDAIHTLAKAMSRSRRKDLATDLVERNRPAPVLEQKLKVQHSQGLSI